VGPQLWGLAEFRQRITVQQLLYKHPQRGQRQEDQRDKVDYCLEQGGIPLSIFRRKVVLSLDITE
jgi:hypothetical protein